MGRKERGGADVPLSRGKELGPYLTMWPGLRSTSVPSGIFIHPAGWLVGWSLTSFFSTNTAISETKGQGWRDIHPAVWPQ